MLFDEPVQFSSIAGLQLVMNLAWKPISRALSEEASTLGKKASSACKMSNCLDCSAVNHFLNDPSLSPLFRILGRASLICDAHVVMHSFPVWTNNIVAKACFKETLERLFYLMPESLND